MLLMVKNELEEEHVTQFINMKKVKNKCIKDYDQNKGFYDDLKHQDVNNLYGWAMPLKLPLNNFEWIKGTSKFNEGLK